MNRDVAARIRNRLTLSYTALLLLLLLSFTCIAFTALFLIWYKEEKQEVLALAQEEWQENIGYVAHSGQAVPEKRDRRYLVRISRGRFFYYVITSDGRVVDGDEIVPELRESFLRQVAGWVPQDEAVRSATIRSPHTGETYHLLIAAKAMRDGSRIAGVVYTGKNISFLWGVVRTFLLILAGLLLASAAVLALVGRYMAKKAIVPLTLAYTRQKEFLADVSHELRAPLTVLQASLDVLEAEEGQRFGSYARQLVKDMKNEVRSMGTLVSDLLLLARADAGQLEMRRERIDVAAVAEEAYRSFSRVAEQKGIRLRLESPDGVMLYADREKIRRLCLILLDNAVTFTPEGGCVTFRLSVRPHPAPAACVIAVEDTGIGIPPDEQERIFERFYRVEKHRSREKGGSGLGLAIAKWIAQAHGGTIAVASEAGRGSVFTVTLPLR